MSSTNTWRIINVLERLGRDYQFDTKREHRYRQRHGAHSQRSDVAFVLPSGRAALYFEIDNRPDRAAFNRLKVFGDPVSLAQLPISIVAVQFGGASFDDSAEPVIRQGLELPPTFVVSLRVDPEDKRLYSHIKAQLEPFLTGSAIPHTGSHPDVAGILRAYQGLQCFGALDVAAAHLEAVSELVWARVGIDPDAVERAVATSCAHARLLQQAGRYPEARTAFRRLRTGLKASRRRTHVSDVLSDEIDTVGFKLRLPTYGSRNAPGLLERAGSSLHRIENRAKFVWRSALEAAVRNQPRLVGEKLALYATMQAQRANGQANVALVGASSALLLRGSGWRNAAIEDSARYAQVERDMWASYESVDTGSIHGVLTSLYLQAAVLRACRFVDRSLSQLLRDIERVRLRSHVSWMADGLRDIAPLRERCTWNPDMALPEAVSLRTSLSGATRRDVDELVARMNDMIRGARSQ